MNKPFSLKVKETQEKIIQIINEASLPAYCIKQILNEIFKEVDDLDKKEIEQYLENINKEEGK